MWIVEFTPKARRQARRLPKKIQDVLALLVTDLRIAGAVCPQWPHFGKLQGRSGEFHCHLNKGKPRYVAVWGEVEGEIQLIEVRYVGTHEKAPY